MSLDSVDDLEVAEDAYFDLAGDARVLKQDLRRLVPRVASREVRDALIALARRLDKMADTSGYCRPTCAGLEDGDDHDDDCGCPCGHPGES